MSPQHGAHDVVVFSVDADEGLVAVAVVVLDSVVVASAVLVAAVAAVAVVVTSTVAPALVSEVTEGSDVASLPIGLKQPAHSAQSTPVAWRAPVLLG